MRSLRRRIYAFISVSIALASVLAFSGVEEAQAAVNADPWVRTGGTALRDEFETIMAHGGMEDVTKTYTGGATGTASTLLVGAGAGLAIGTAGLRLYSKISTGSWDTYTEGLNCGNDWVGKAGDFVGKAFKFMTFGFGGYTCNTAPGAVKTADLPTVDLSHPTVDKAPVPDPPAPAYRIDYTREYQIKSSTPQCNVTFPVRVHFTGYDKDGFFADVTNPNRFAISSAVHSDNTCAFGALMYGYAVYFDGNGLTTLGYAGARTIASGETVNRVKFGIRSHMLGFPDSSAGKKLQCIGDDYSQGHFSLSNCLAGTPQGTSVVTKGDNATLQRQITCRVTASDGTHTDAGGVSYSDAGGIPLDSEKWGCNHAWQQTISAGKTPQRITATSTFPGAVGDPKVLINESVNPDVQKEVIDHPECVNASSNSTGCVKRLYKLVGGQLRSCSDADVWDSCAEWQTESQTHPDEYVCKYGSKNVGLDECAMYAPTFKHPQADTQLHYKTDEDADTKLDTSAVPQSEPDSKNCWAGMISWNPVDWVLTPIKCAAIWAFEPTDTATWQRVGDAWHGTAPAVVASTLSGGIEMPQAGNGCSGPYVDLKSVSGRFLSYQGYPLSACGDPMRTMADRFRMVAQVLLYASTLWMVIRNITAMFNVPPPAGAIPTTD